MAAESGTDDLSERETATDPPPGPPQDTPKRLRLSSWSIVRSILLVVGVLAAISIVVAASTPIWWLAIAAAIAGLFLPAVRWLGRYLPGGVAIVIVIVGVSGATGLIGYRGFDESRAQFDTLQANATSAARDLETSKQFGQVATEFNLTEKVSTAFDNVPFVQVGGRGDAATRVQSAASNGGALFAIAMLSLLLLIFGRKMARDAIGQIQDAGVAARVRTLVFESYHASARYVYMMSVRAVVVGVVGGVACAVGGMGTPTALGLWFAVLSLVPGIGLVVAALPIALYAAITSLPLAAFVFFVAVLAQLFDSVVVQRRIDAHSVRVGPGVTLISALIGIQLYGVGGGLVLLAVALFVMSLLARLTDGDVDIFTAIRIIADNDAASEPSASSPIASAL